MIDDERRKTLLIHVHNRRRIQFNLSGIYPMLPLGIAMLGAQMERANLPVELLDLALRENFKLDVARKVADEGFGLVGLSATLFSLPESIELTVRIKALSPMTRVVLGGPAANFPPGEIFHYLPGLDGIFCGEGEGVIAELARRAGTADWTDIPGLVFRREGMIRINPPAPPLAMDELPYPARRLLPRGIYRMHPPFCRFPPLTLVETARGCPYNCVFCSLPRQWRARSIAHVLGEIRQVIAEEKIREVHFVDPTFTADPERTAALVEALAPLGLHYTCKSRVDLVTPALLAAMKRAGFYLVSYGVESLRREDMEFLNKDMDAALSLQVLRETKRAGLDVIAYMLLGNPGQRRCDVTDTVRRLVRVGCDFALFAELYPDPGSSLTHEAIRKGWLTMREVAEFYFRRLPPPARSIQTGLPGRNGRRWVLLAFLLFYFSPRGLLRMAGRGRTYRDSWRLLHAGLILLKDMLLPKTTV